MLAFYLSLIDSPEARTKFENIYYSYRSVMFHSANQVLHNAHDAEDIVADSFLAVINILDAIDSTDEDKARNLMITISKNRALNFLKKKKRAVLIEEEIEMPQECDHPSPAIDNLELADALSKLIRQLPSEQQDVLRLQYYYDYSYQQISQLIGKREATIRQMSLRAKKKLRQMLEEREIQHG
ncbi:RNA polymerase sigma factor [Massiliimalia timonensis]|uniref:RNA polymerase sigma factor n=1 Tax=Massiliimalia timonensis TaxID=1987501 RepID=UPI001319D46C|nr:RNA polymerase sigma factor [Massiliimalia timonensis]